MSNESANRDAKYTGWEIFAIFDWNYRLFRKRYEIGPLLLRNFSRKSQVADRTVSVTMTLNDLERRDAMGHFFQADLLNNVPSVWRSNAPGHLLIHPVKSPLNHMPLRSNAPSPLKETSCVMLLIWRVLALMLLIKQKLVRWYFNTLSEKNLSYATHLKG